MYAFKMHSRSYALVAVAALGFGFAGCNGPAPAAPAIDDATLSSSLQSRITGDSVLAHESIQTSVQNGVATLNGSVSSEAARALAASDAAQVAGIRTVVNNLSVQQAAAPVTVVTPAPLPVPVIAPIKKPVPAPRVKTAPVISNPAPIERHEHVARQEPLSEPVPAPAPIPAPPAFRNVTVSSGTTIPVRITQTLDSATSQLGQTFSGTVATDIMADGLVAVRQGTAVTGRISAVQEAAHYKGSSLLTIELTSINRRGETLAVSTSPYSVEGKGRGKNTAAKVGGGAAIGAILGGIIGGGKGAAIGAASGGGLGAGANTVTRGEQVQIPSESLIQFKLTNTLNVRASTSNTLSTGSDTPQRRPMNPPQDQPQ